MLRGNLIHLIILIVFAFLGGFIGYKLKIPAGTLIFSLLAVAGIKLLRNDAGPLPGYMNFVGQSFLGLIIGSQFNQRVLEVISKMWVYMILSVIVLVVAGMIYAIMLARMNSIDLPTAYLSTSPGGLAAMVFMSVDQGINTPLVAIFHLTRIFFILLTGPMILKIIEYLKL